MKTRLFSSVLVLMMIPLLFGLAACSNKVPAPEETSVDDQSIVSVGGNVLAEYSQADDGAWLCKGKSYIFKVELTGRFKNEAQDGRFVVLTNNADITYEDICIALTSSQLSKSLDSNETVIVEMGGLT